MLAASQENLSRPTGAQNYGGQEVVKYYGVAEAALRADSVLRSYMAVHLRSLQKLPSTIRMFFLTPGAPYAVLWPAAVPLSMSTYL